MSSFNRVILVGNLTRDPQLKYLPSNTAVCEFGLATNRKWRDKEGNQKEEVCFVDISAFGKQGEVINQYMTKGRSILIEGHLKLDTWQAQDGSKRWKHSVVVENFTFLGGPRDGGSGGGGAPADNTRRDGGWQGQGQSQGQNAPQRAPARSYSEPPPQQPPQDDSGYDPAPPPTGEQIPF